MRSDGHVPASRYSEAISAAADLFLEVGIDEVKMTDIAERANIGVATLYRYFSTKTMIVIQAGRILWNRLSDEFALYLTGDSSQTGLEQVVYCLGFFKRMFDHHKPFMKFLDDFDKLMLAEKVSKEELADYEKSITNLYDPFTEAFERGVKDGTLKSDVNFNLVYVSMTHALIAATQKFIRGEILPHDNFSIAGMEIDQLIDIIVKYIAA